MIKRYSRPEMAEIWTDDSKYAIWLEIETLAAEAMEMNETIPLGTAEAVRSHGRFNVKRINEIEAEVKHDVIAFLTNVAENVGEPAKHLHKGLTSSDILDTCLAIQLTRASDILLKGIDLVLFAIKTQAYKHRLTPSMGRSHGIHAEPLTLGLKFAGYFAEFARGRQRLLTAREEIAVCAISGAVGTYANVDPKVEEYVAQRLGLKAETISTQIIPRDRHAMYFSVLGVIASSIERLATEIRHMQRTELLEAEEYFSKGQKGSSAMPHKRNPVLTENLTGLARLVRSSVTPALENVVLWHERDISHSSVERGIAPDATVHLDFALHRLADVIENLTIYPDKLMRNLELLDGLHNSQRVLLALIEAGTSREDAYIIVQRNAMTTWAGKGNFLSSLKSDDDVKSRLSDEELEGLFDLDYHFKHVDYIFQKVFGD